MKHFIYFLVLSLFLISCGDDEPEINLLSYDGDNLTAPSLPGGNHEMAVRFPSFETSEFQGRSLTEVQVFMYDVPSDIAMNIYTEGNSSGPDFSTVTQYEVGGLTPNSWNNLVLPQAFTITSEMWISFNWSQSGQQQVIGCDAGPANPNGDWIILSTDSRGWTSFRDISGGESVNWNIRGVVE